jgi:acyl-CoA synthetase (AMP-forming)/AMP-acid ligase II
MTITALSRDLVADETHSDWRARRASVGVSQSCVDLKILRSDGSEAMPGEAGEVAVRGPTVMKGYWNNEEASAKAIRDGWLMTGDLGHVNQDGFLTLTDRSKDVIISGGTNIYPREVEEVLLRHLSVYEAAVIGVPDSEWGEVTLAFVVCRPGHTCEQADLDAWCKQYIASFKKPKLYRFVDKLPKNSYGKVLKTQLRDAAQEPLRCS